MNLHVAIFGILSLGCISGLLGAPVFDRVFGSHMVLPCDQALVISGTNANTGNTVTVRFGDHSVTANPNSDGIWKVKLPPLKADKTGRPLSVSQDGSSTILEDVLVGVVWVASGQSNMQWRLNQSTTGARDIPKANNPNLRILNNTFRVLISGKAYTEEEYAKLNKDDFYAGKWEPCTPQTAAQCSGVAYYFANRLQQELDIPVGIIHSSFGGSEMVAWLPESLLTSKTFYKSCLDKNWPDSPFISNWVRQVAKRNVASYKGEGAPNHPFRPGFLYESGIKWITKLPVSGVIWYQGESDAEINDSAQNTTVLTNLIQSWRKEFNNASLPFIMVELPRINDSTPMRAYWPEFREVQQRVAQTLPQVFSVNTIDLGSTNSDVHPPDKEPVGYRMANTALHHLYGKKDIPADGPRFERIQIVNNAVVISFSNADGLTTTDGKEPIGFTIASSNGEFTEATATIDSGEKVTISSPKIRSPKYIRYCWSPFAAPNLVNKDGIPASPFRTDHQRSNK